MEIGFVIRKNQYYDSVFLMGINNKISQVPGVQNSAVLMGTDSNKGLLSEIGVGGPEIDAATPNDLIVAVVSGDKTVVESILVDLNHWLESGTAQFSEIRLKTLEDGLAAKPTANLAVISVPGAYAFREARKALEKGLNVFLFSDNVPASEELALKRLASEKDLLVMGPDCGTSILNGIGVGFANQVRKGKVGVVGASGTGIQEFTSQIHNAGLGISQAIGTGGHDLSDEIGGITTLAGLKVLENDTNTDVIAVISKPPGQATMKKILEEVATYRKPVIGCFLGLAPESDQGNSVIRLVRTIDEAVVLSISAARGPGGHSAIELSDKELGQADQERQALSPGQKYIRGVFAGGTFCYQAQQVFQDAGIRVYSNTPISKANKLEDPDRSKQHTMVDMGDDRYTVGKPHPMIDGTFRQKRILQESKDPEVAVILLDIILGYNASPDPVGDIIDAVIEAKRLAKSRGNSLVVVASICGTDEDFQDRGLQLSLLEQAGVIVFDSNARAAAFCEKLLKLGNDGAK